MEKYYAREALLPHGWERDLVFSIEEGNLVSLETGTEGLPLPGPVVPGMANLHSHAFQRAMAGLTEARGSPHDDFWSWRELMYRFVERITPAQARAVARFLYIEMLKHGYTAVAEFHYVHHPADLLAEHLAAAREAGIAITLLPSVYRWSGFGTRALQPRQKRFDQDARAVLDALAALRAQANEEVKLGVSPHSLRAVDAQELKFLLQAIPQDLPIHIHAAEQTKEVEECVAALGKRPVQWLLENCAVNERWCVVHATHIDRDETCALAKSGAVAGLCPSTEGNLGDGIFPLPAYREAGGRYGIGGDSHVSRNPAEELRWLEYVQRLTARRRNLAVSTISSSVGTTLWLEAAAGGGQAVGRRMGALAPGTRADLVVLDAEHPDLAGKSGDVLADALVFSGSSDLVRDVMVAGRWAVRARRHAAEESAAAAYKHAVAALLR